MCISPWLKIILLIAISCINSVVYGDQTQSPLTKHQIVQMLWELKPLPKVHYSYTLLSSNIIDDPEDRRLYEYARITHALTPQGEGVTFKQLDNCVYTCARINKTNPQIPVSMAFGFNAWHRKFDKALPPTNRGASYYAEIAYFEDRLKFIKKSMAKLNEKYRSNVKVSALLLDSERFYIRKGNDKWNNAIKEALDAIHIKAKSIFPDATIEWYGRGVSVRWKGDKWYLDKTRGFTGKEIMPSLSCSLYTLPELERMREIFRQTCQLADKYKVEDVTPWVALAAGWKRELGKRYWESDWRYDLVYSHQIGAELNIKEYGDQPKRYAPYNRAKVIIFYPQPFNARTPDWPRHFIAYVRGATGISDLSDLGYDR